MDPTNGKTADTCAPVALGAVLVTGASGFIGGALCRRLAAQGVCFRPVSRNPEASPFAGTVRMPGPGQSRAWADLLQGITHVVHCAGIAHSTSALSEADYYAANAALAGEVAAAAAGAIAGRFVQLSSVRAVCGPVADGVVTESTEPAPQDAYGRSKLAGEALVRDAYAGDDRFAILRPVVVYGDGMKGNMAALLRLARLPVPLPFAGLTAPRSLLDIESCVEAILHTLCCEATRGGTFVVADRDPVGVASILAAFRRGFGRPRMLFALPPRLLAAMFVAAGRAEAWRRVSGPLVAVSSALTATGWVSRADTGKRLEGLARRRAIGSAS